MTVIGCRSKRQKATDFIFCTHGNIFRFVSLFHDANRPIKSTLYFVHNICFHLMPAIITNLHQTKHKHAHKHMRMRVFIVP